MRNFTNMVKKGYVCLHMQQSFRSFVAQKNCASVPRNPLAHTYEKGTI